MNNPYPIQKLEKLETPFYYYDMNLLKETLKVVKQENDKYGYITHYAVKANANRRILETIATKGFGADCVSGNEIKAALLAGFPASKIVFAGVGKTDKEINFALDNNIFCFNVESVAELHVLSELAAKKGKEVQIALRINPNVDAYTHEYITTGKKENKFGFAMEQLEYVTTQLKSYKNIKLLGIHFHIGSQIENLAVFKDLSERVNELQTFFEAKGFVLEHINLGGGLGVDYDAPEINAIPNFADYFKLFNDNLTQRNGQSVHFELGRSLVAQCGTLISRVTYVKDGVSKQFVVLDAGMNDLIRPALYQATHKIANITSDLPTKLYDIVGPVCESADCFAKNYALNETKRGDLVALKSAGAYGEIMAFQYNCRELAKAYFSDKL